MPRLQRTMAGHLQPGRCRENLPDLQHHLRRRMRQEGEEKTMNDNDNSDYFQEVGSFKVLTPTENAVLARRKTPEALEELINANLRLVVYWAKRFAAVTGMDIDDLIQEGN